jgi:hypothetical protein
VSSQRDAEQADIARERGELAADPDLELGELAGIYQRRGLDEELARTVAGKGTRVPPVPGCSARVAGRSSVEPCHVATVANGDPTDSV